MQKTIDDMKGWLKAVYDVTPAPDGFRVINSKAASDMSQCISEFANLLKDHDSDLYAFILGLTSRMFLAQVEPLFGTRTGGLVVDKTCLGYLDAAVDFCSSPLFQIKPKERSAKIFISHSSEDVEYVKAFVGMLEKLGVRQEQLFCSSIPGYNIPLGENIYDYLRKQFEDYSLYVIIMLSKNYNKSYACLNEMGAAWVLKTDYQAILLPGFTYKSIGGAVDPQKISFKLNDVKERASRLTELKNKIVELLGLVSIDEVIWERHKINFEEEVDKIFLASKTK